MVGEEEGGDMGRTGSDGGEERYAFVKIPT